MSLIALYAWLLQIQQVHTVADALQTRGASKVRAESVAIAIQHHAKQLKLDPFLVTAIVTVENPELRASARNRSGAHGIMQVMPGWLRQRPDWRRECGSNLANINTNICWGMRVLRLHLDEHPKSLRKGLLAFNGCRRASCKQYATIILQRRAQYASGSP